MPATLINTSNLHAGGGVQVATSFLSEVIARRGNQSEVSAVVSSTVERNLTFMGDLPTDRIEIETLDVRGLNLLDRAARQKLGKFQTVFTVFGPLYRWTPPFRSIVGFAQPWIIYPTNECYARLGPLQRLGTRLKYWIQGQFFRRADLLVVELAHVKDGLVRELGIDPDRIHVVHNCLSRVYRDATLWQEVPIPPTDADLRLGYLGRNYLHKNIGIFPAVAEALQRVHGLRARFYVTFTDEEWRSCTQNFRDICVNVGPLTVTQCPMFYKALDGVVFPSLLECFSATPLEAMAMGVPLFASDRPFNREVCGPHASYFDPLDPEHAAAQIAASLGPRSRPDQALLQRAREHALAFSSPEERANAYLALMTRDQDTNI